jgi:hypothetical protein
MADQDTNKSIEEQLAAEILRLTNGLDNNVYAVSEALVVYMSITAAKMARASGNESAMAQALSDLKEY